MTEESPMVGRREYYKRRYEELSEAADVETVHVIGAFRPMGNDVLLVWAKSEEEAMEKGESVADESSKSPLLEYLGEAEEIAGGEKSVLGVCSPRNPEAQD